MPGLVPPEASVSTAYIQSLQLKVHLLTEICRAAGAILSDDDDFETIRRRFTGELKQRYRLAQAEYVRETGRSAP